MNLEAEITQGESVDSMSVNSATCASLCSHDLFARCAVTPVRNFLCKNWSVIVSIDKQIKVWLVYRFFKRHLPWNPPLNSSLIWDLQLLNPPKYPKYWLLTKFWTQNYTSVLRVLSWYFLAQSLLNWARAAEREAGGGRSQTRRSQGARQRAVSRAVIHHYLTVDTDNPPTANHSPAFSPDSQSEARSLWWSGVTLSGLTTGPWWMIGRWSMVCCKLGCIIPHQFTSRHQAGEGRHSNSLENSRRLIFSKSL